MDPVALFIVGLLLIAILLGPKYGAEDRPGFKDLRVKPRPVVGSMRRSDWRRRF